MYPTLPPPPLPCARRHRWALGGEYIAPRRGGAPRSDRVRGLRCDRVCVLRSGGAGGLLDSAPERGWCLDWAAASFWKADPAWRQEIVLSLEPVSLSVELSLSSEPVCSAVDPRWDRGWWLQWSRGATSFRT